MADSSKVVELKVRVTEEQAAWVRERAETQYGGKVSEAIRSALADARALELARQDYERLVAEQGFRLPRNAPEGGTTLLEVILDAPRLGFEFRW